MAIFSGDTENLAADRSCMPAGQGSGAIHEVLPAGEIVRRVVAEAQQVIGKLGELT
jgi:enoyl-[acyl-carrier protein] reductase II